MLSSVCHCSLREKWCRLKKEDVLVVRCVSSGSNRQYLHEGSIGVPLKSSSRHDLTRISTKDCQEASIDIHLAKTTRSRKLLFFMGVVVYGGEGGLGVNICARFGIFLVVCFTHASFVTSEATASSNRVIGSDYTFSVVHTSYISFNGNGMSFSGRWQVSGYTSIAPCFSTVYLVSKLSEVTPMTGNR